ncbi:MAG TPA: DUF1801 domain-containing protein [Niabella sp.]|nr:DUF1801 domain-containing protein [Niabella sp.]HOZ95884.1 DUF1801 domain-containing protein [Niabella sp.]HQW15796.1 DUF1801 domain-containing protein [Niabella sp.]HQX20936.1 DUF1801 domain-containing protein [Niabella sp.]HQX41420.1 DUF1801 domain-containing protein [Niabella sp.]
MAKTDFKTIDQYHQQFSGEVLNRLQSIRNIIHTAVPRVEECISYQIPCFKHHGYLIYYSAFAKHISLSHPYSESFRLHFATELEEYKTSKAVIQFPNDKTLPVAFIKKIIAFRKKENEDKTKQK